MRSRATLAKELEATFGEAELVELHSAPTRIGGVIGGIDAIVDAVIDALGDRRTVLVPTFTSQLTDPAGWSRPSAPEHEWDTIRREMPLFDPEKTTPRRMGRLADLLFRRPGARRSHHPAESVAAYGPRADWLVAPHPIDDPMGVRSPWARLVARDARVVLAGVDLNNCTLLHHAEQLAGVPYLERAAYSVPVALPDGERAWIEVVAGGACSEGFPNVRSRLIERGVLSEVHVGEARTLIASASSLVADVVELLRRDPFALLCRAGTCSTCDDARLA